MGLRTLVLLIALCRPAASEVCADPDERVCQEACYPDKGQNIDDDCCATRDTASCAAGYRLVKTSKVCYDEGEVKAHETCCVLCDDDDDCDNGPGDEYLDENECPDHGALLIIWIIFMIIFVGCCASSWTFCIIGFINFQKFGTGQPLCCPGCGSPNCWFGMNACLAVGNLFMFILMCVFGDIAGIVCYLLLLIGTAAAAGVLISKKANWNEASRQVGLQQPTQGPIMVAYGGQQPVPMGQVVQGVEMQTMGQQPVVGQVVVAQSIPVKSL